MAKKKVAKTEDDLQREFWRSKGGEFHGPNVETGTMPEAKLLPLLRTLRGVPKISWGPYLPGMKLRQARMLEINGNVTQALRFERWEEDPSLDAVDQVLKALASVGAIEYVRVSEEWPLG